LATSLQKFPGTIAPLSVTMSSAASSSGEPASSGLNHDKAAVASRTTLVAAAFIVAISACSTGGSEINPTVTQVNPQSNSKLQFVVGTANIAADGVVGLNVVATLRQPNGNSAVLADLPTIAGPPGFTVPNTTA